MESEQLYTRAKTLIPGGVNSPVRAFGAVGGVPRFIASASGAYLTDADGRTYVDMVGSWGPMLLGHTHPEVLAAITGAAQRGFSFGAPTAAEVELAAAIVDRIPPVEQVRLVSSGTEATMSALRLARGYTGRSKVVKFAGCYHGHSDAFLVAAGSGAITFGQPDSAGVTPGAVADTIVVDYNDIPALEAAFAGGDIAAVITEAAPGNMGVVPPAPGFNARISQLCTEHGAVFISDEVMTGFRVTAQGHWGRDGAVEGWQPDLMTFGKVMGGGFPAAAFGGRADIMAQLAPVGPVYQAGTLSGNPVAMAAGLATLRLATPDVYHHIDSVADQLRKLIAAELTSAGVPHTIQSAGNMFSIFFTDRPVENFAAAQASDTFRYPAFFHAMLDHGVYLPPSAYEAWFVSAAHDEKAVEQIAAALPAAARAAASATIGS